MTKKHLLQVILLLSLVLIISNSFAQVKEGQNEASHAQIENMVKYLDIAYKARDTQNYIRFFSVKYTDEQNGGRTYAEILGTIEKEFKERFNITLTREDLEIDAKLNNDTATVTSRVTLKWEEGENLDRMYNAFDEKMRLQSIGGNLWQIESRQFSNFRTATPGLLLHRLSKSMIFWTFIIILLIVFLLYYKNRKQQLDRLKK
jgi:hypothetical protein